MVTVAVRDHADVRAIAVAVAVAVSVSVIEQVLRVAVGV
jgi:hypothetical protein